MKSHHFQYVTMLGLIVLAILVLQLGQKESDQWHKQQMINEYVRETLHNLHETDKAVERLLTSEQQ